MARPSLQVTIKLLNELAPCRDADSSRTTRQTEPAQFILGPSYLKCDAVNTYYVQFLTISSIALTTSERPGCEEHWGGLLKAPPPACVIRPGICRRVMFGALCAFTAVDGDL